MHRLPDDSEGTYPTTTAGFVVKGSGNQIINSHSEGHETGFDIQGQDNYLHGNSSRIPRSSEDPPADVEDDHRRGR